MDVEVVEHLDQEKSKLLLLSGGEGIEQVAANAGDVGRSEATMELPPFRCEACVDTTAILGGAVASDQPGLFQSADAVGEPARREQRLVGELTHAEPLLGSFGEVGKHEAATEMILV